MKVKWRLIFFVIAWGSVAIWAGENQVEKLIKEEQRLSALIKRAYINGENTSGYFLKLTRIHEELRRYIHEGEAESMMRFLDYCLDDLKNALKISKTMANAEIVSDLDGSIQEGCHYISAIARKKEKN
jgi:hypothetical protein